jgi:hypothetical protein
VVATDGAPERGSEHRGIGPSPPNDRLPERCEKARVVRDAVIATLAFAYSLWGVIAERSAQAQVEAAHGREEAMA